jgi:tRNA uridine 5-carboxymethylaminomethyl modification enzyme
MGRQLGLVDDERWALFEAKRQACAQELQRLNTLRLKPADVPGPWAERVLGAPLARDVTAFELLRRPEVSYDSLLEVAGPPAWMSPEGAAANTPAAFADERLPPQVRTQVEVHARYAGYIERQEDEIERARRNEEAPLPADLDYAQLSGLSHEVRQRLAEARPATVGQAARIPGVTPAAVSILLVHLKKRALRVPPKVA